MIKQKGQLYWDDETVTLSDDVFSLMLSDKTESKYKKAFDFFSSLRECINLDIISDFKWLKTQYTVPYFVDFCFMYKTTLYGVIFAGMKDDGMLEKTPLIEEEIKMCKKYDIVPVILPFDKMGEVIVTGRSLFSLLDAEKYYAEGIIEDVDITKASEEYKECSKWELLHSSVSALVENLKKDGINEILYQSYPGVFPQICYIDKDKAFNWIAQDIVKERDERPKRNDILLSAMLKKGGKGHYALAEISNPYAPNVFPRGQKFDIRCEITDL